MSETGATRVKSIFLEVSEAAPEERQALLNERCGSDMALRADVERLLASEAFIEAQFLEGGPGIDLKALLETSIDTPPVQEGPGSVIGRYKILQRIGEGGFGVVYMAEQTEPVSRVVALKIIKLGMDTKQVIARFEAERKALALMHHPNIASMLDAGTTNTGRPYFVMELVKGIPLTQYCDENRLATPARLDLFVDVCRAIQHAHQKGIIHRDLKPSNVMVTIHGDRRVAKVIDFGIAKALHQELTEKTLFTAYGQLIGTPEYMSPEQAEVSGLDVDTRSDVYALGVLLYELLSGTCPFDSERLRSAGYGEMCRIIREETPPRPSTRIYDLPSCKDDERREDDTRRRSAEFVATHRATDQYSLARTLRRDLDWIVMKCLEKDRTRRYDSAAGLADDVLRYRASEPVLASPPRAIYRASKFIRRHRVGVSFAAIVAVSLFAATGVSIIFAIGESRARADAQREAENAKAVSDFLTKEVIPSVDPWRSPRRDMTIITMLDTASERLDDRFDDPIVEASIRYTLGATYQNLGDHARAREHLKRALVLRAEALGDEHPLTNWVRFLLALDAYFDRRFDEAEDLIDRVVEGWHADLGDRDKATLDAMKWQGQILMALGRHAEAQPILEKALDGMRDVLDEGDRATLGTQRSLGAIYQAQGDFAKAEDLLVRARESALRHQGPDWPGTWTIHRFLGWLRMDQGRFKEAEDLFRAALENVSPIIGPDHQQTLWAQAGLLWALRAQGKIDEAVQQGRDLLAARTRALGADHADTIEAAQDLASLHVLRAREDDAVPLFRESLRVVAEKDGAPAWLLHRAAWNVVMHDGLEDALYDEALAVVRRADAMDPENADILITRSAAEYRTGNFECAAETLRAATDVRPSSDPRAWAFLAMANARLGREGEASRAMVALASIIRTPQFANDKESLTLRREAERVLADSGIDLDPDGTP